jgi:hypothetical protein
MMRVFRACLVPDSRLLGFARGSISQYPEAPNSLVAGKKAGNFADSAVFWENPSRKHMQIQQFAR